MVNRCPCCHEPLTGGPLHLTTVVPDARLGDRYCLTCEWLITDALLAESERVVCPMHPIPVASPGVGPGAQSVWEAVVMRCASNVRWSRQQVAVSQALMTLGRRRRALVPFR